MTDQIKAIGYINDIRKLDDRWVHRRLIDHDRQFFITHHAVKRFLERIEDQEPYEKLSHYDITKYMDWATTKAMSEGCVQEGWDTTGARSIKLVDISNQTDEKLVTVITPSVRKVSGYSSVILTVLTHEHVRESNRDYARGLLPDTDTQQGLSEIEGLEDEQEQQEINVMQTKTQLSTWDQRWIDMVHLIATWSKDRSRKIAAVIVDSRNVLVSMGWNGFPRGVDDDVDERHQRPVKYDYTEHAERNAIYNAAANGVRLMGCTLYQGFYPCAHCARAIIQSGITEVVCAEPDWQDPTYRDEFAKTREMFDEAGVGVRFLEGLEPPVRKEQLS